VTKCNLIFAYPKYGKKHSIKNTNPSLKEIPKKVAYLFKNEESKIESTRFDQLN